MAVGNNTFINDILNKTGFHNVFECLERYPEVVEDSIKKANPEYILLSSEPFPFSEKHMLQFKKQFPNSKILLVDGEMFSWYGSRLKLAPEYIKSLPI